MWWVITIVAGLFFPTHLLVLYIFHLEYLQDSKVSPKWSGIVARLSSHSKNMAKCHSQICTIIESSDLGPTSDAHNQLRVLIVLLYAPDSRYKATKIPFLTDDINLALFGDLICHDLQKHANYVDLNWSLWSTAYNMQCGFPGKDPCRCSCMCRSWYRIIWHVYQDRVSSGVDLMVHGQMSDRWDLQTMSDAIYLMDLVFKWMSQRKVSLHEVLSDTCTNNELLQLMSILWVCHCCARHSCK